MDNLGYQITTLLAGLGVGGIAVALAAQKLLEDLPGSIIIYNHNQYMLVIFANLAPL